MDTYDGPTPYVYQPFGAVTHPKHKEQGRLYGIGGHHHLSTIEGLTEEEAEAIAELLRDMKDDAKRADQQEDGADG